MSRGVRKLLGFAIGTTAAWAFVVKPRVWGKPDLREIRRYDYARRGLVPAGEDIPENSLDAFQEAMAHGYGITMDVRLRDDGVPVVADGTLEEALELVNGQVPVVLELWPCEESIAYLCESICRVVDSYQGIFVIQAMDPRILRWFRQERNEYIRAQMIDYNYSSGNSWRARIWDLFCNSLFLNCLTEPDLISCSRTTQYNPSVWLCRILYRIPRMVWPIDSLEEYEYARMDGAIAVFTDIEP